jgi:hypothetical protein
MIDGDDFIRWAGKVASATLADEVVCRSAVSHEHRLLQEANWPNN